MQIQKFFKNFTLRRIFENVFYKLEDNYPNAAHIIRFHSIKDEFLSEDQKRTELIDVDWFSEKYRSSFRQLASRDELENLDFSSSERVPLNTYVIRNFYIDGHIKAPIRASSGKILSLTHPDRLRWGDVFPQPFFKNIHLDGIIIFIPNIENYYHLMVDHILPSLHRLIFDPSLAGQKVNFVLQRELPIIVFFMEFLNRQGFKTDKFTLRNFHRLTGEALLIGRALPRDHGCYFVFSELLKLFDRFIDEKISTIDVPELVYIERANTPRRKILNQVEISEALKNFGFVPVSFSYKNYLYQIAIFRKSKVIISVHGASLTNLIWSKSISVIEIFPEDLRPKHYLNISAQLGLSYYPVLGAMAGAKEHFNLDPQKLLSVIRTQLLGKSY